MTPAIVRPPVADAAVLSLGGDYDGEILAGPGARPDSQRWPFVQRSGPRRCAVAPDRALISTRARPHQDYDCAVFGRMWPLSAAHGRGGNTQEFSLLGAGAGSGAVILTSVTSLAQVAGSRLRGLQQDSPRLNRGQPWRLLRARGCRDVRPCGRPTSGYATLTGHLCNKRAHAAWRRSGGCCTRAERISGRAERRLPYPRDCVPAVDPTFPVGLWRSGELELSYPCRRPHLSGPLRPGSPIPAKGTRPYASPVWPPRSERVSSAIRDIHVGHPWRTFTSAGAPLLPTRNRKARP